MNQEDQDTGIATEDLDQDHLAEVEVHQDTEKEIVVVHQEHNHHLHLPIICNSFLLNINFFVKQPQKQLNFTPLQNSINSWKMN